LSTDDEI
jgi:hypothetical protein